MTATEAHIRIGEITGNWNLGARVSEVFGNDADRVIREAPTFLVQAGATTLEVQALSERWVDWSDSDPMTFPAFVRLVRTMRIHQRDFDRNRTPGRLRDARQLEREVDDEVKLLFGQVTPPTFAGEGDSR